MNKPAAVGAQVLKRIAGERWEALEVAGTVEVDIAEVGTAEVGTVEVGTVVVGIVGADIVGADIVKGGTAGVDIVEVGVCVDLPNQVAAKHGVLVLSSLAEQVSIGECLESDHTQEQSRLRCLAQTCYLAQAFCRNLVDGKRLTGFVLC